MLTFHYRGTLLVTLVVIVSWLESAQGSPSHAQLCKILDRRFGLSAAQFHICLREGPRSLQKVVMPAQLEDFPEECEYWMADERWNCTNISMPVFPKSFQSPDYWVHKRESRQLAVCVRARNVIVNVYFVLFNALFLTIAV